MERTVTVKEAIEMLSKLNPNADLYVGDGWSHSAEPINRIEEHSGKAWVVSTETPRILYPSSSGKQPFKIN